MKKFATAVIFLVMTLSQAAFAQSTSGFEGEWIGTITAGEHSVSVRLVIHGNQARQYFKTDEGWEPVTPDKIDFLIDRNNAVMVWMNSGGVWSETQVYSLSMKSGRELDIVWTRHVNNVREGGNNETWNLVGNGTLTKVG